MDDTKIKKYNELRMKLMKMAGYLSDHYIDQAIETEDYSFISGALIDYFLRKDPNYLLSKYNEFGLNETVEDMDFDIKEWYKLNEVKSTDTIIEELVEKRKPTE